MSSNENFALQKTNSKNAISEALQNIKRARINLNQTTTIEFEQESPRHGMKRRRLSPFTSKETRNQQTLA